MRSWLRTLAEPVAHEIWTPLQAVSQRLCGARWKLFPTSAGIYRINAHDRYSFLAKKFGPLASSWLVTIMPRR